MIIKEIYIEAFGKLRQEKILFSNGLNCAVHENGYGKTTLTLFVKAMFFGLDDSRRSVAENERKRYLPWSGGNAGGYIVFSYNGKDYRIERSFGKKASDDTIAVYDITVGCTTDIFGQTPGEVIFEIDRDGFERTIFLSERLLCGPIENDTVTGKLSNLVGVEYDIGEFDNAISLLEEKKKYYRKRGGGGEIAEAKQKLGESEARLEDIIRKRAEYNRNLEIIEEKEKRAALIRDRVAGHEAGANEEKLRDQELGYQRQYLIMSDALEEARAKLSEKAAKLGGRVPTVDEIIYAKGKRIEAERIASALEAGRSNYTPPFKTAPDIEKISDFEKRLSAFNKVKRPAGSMLTIMVIIMVAGAVCSLLGKILSAYFYIPAAICVFTSLIGLFFSLKSLSSITKRGNEVMELFTYGEEIYPELDENITAEELITKMKQDLGEYQRHAENTERDNELMKQYTAAKLEADSFFTSFLPIPEEGLLSYVEDYNVLEATVKSRARELEDYAERYGIDPSKIDRNSLSQHRESNHTSAIKMEYEQVLVIEREIQEIRVINQRLLADIVEIDIVTDQISALREYIDACEEKLYVITETIRLLTAAKNNMNAKYLQPTTESFKKYLAMFNEGGEFTISTDFEVSKSAGGATRERLAFSRGTRELYSFAMRLALIDSLYENEAPPIIIDDAFLSFDDEKIKRLGRILKVLSSTRQIIYLTCSSSRAVQ